MDVGGREGDVGPSDFNGAMAVRPWMEAASPPPAAAAKTSMGPWP